MLQGEGEEAAAAGEEAQEDEDLMVDLSLKKKKKKKKVCVCVGGDMSTTTPHAALAHTAASTFGGTSTLQQSLFQICSGHVHVLHTMTPPEDSC